MGQMKDELQKLVSTYDLTNNVEFLGYRDNISDLINENNSVVVESENIDKIKEGIELLIRDEEKRITLGQKARVSTLDMVKYDIFLKKYSLVYKNSK